MRLFRILLIGFSFVLLNSCVGNRYIGILRVAENEQGNKVYLNSNYQYKFKQGDRLDVVVKKLVIGEDFFEIASLDKATASKVDNTSGYLIDTNGMINLPLLGEFHAEGRSIVQLNSVLSKSAEKEFPGSVVQVTLANGKINVIGEVNTPGEYEFNPLSRDIFSALSSAGGMKDYANREEITIVRKSGKEIKIFTLDVTNRDVLTSENLFLENNDIVIVPALERRKWSTMRDFQWAISGITAIISLSSLIISATK